MTTEPVVVDRNIDRSQMTVSQSEIAELRRAGVIGTRKTPVPE